MLTLIGDPAKLFPLQPGRKNTFENFGISDNGGSPFRGTFACTVGQAEEIDFNFGKKLVTRVECEVTGFKPDIHYYSPEFHSSILQRYHRIPGLGPNKGEQMLKLEKVISWGEGSDYETYVKSG